MTRPVLFIGDSITDAGRRDDPEGLGAGWVQLVHDALRERGDARPILNRGISGDRAIDLAHRWQQDAVEPDPELLTVYVGINDTWRRYDSGLPTSADEFESVYRSLLRQSLAASHVSLVLVEPFLTPVNAEQEEWFADLDPKRDAVDRLAREFDAVFVPLQAVLSVASRLHGAVAVADDGVHPTRLGAELIAEAWLAAVGVGPRSGD
ncbi:SGNH/GDSL hydrolase family protein [Schumannella sp. 10F1B-5-1]|uniref:SGNH/GDSL hydrolase family protein n=1 Tax=Schumannella sp. 10F1B-5-1 TaxID=2590780 RepID=UPI0011326158|nr:SGNH/GDSL hydrolase family protein [Schumannella sp. 10F1B-5-1]TPW78447.1 SGNH/GDSL hydrolase family protein [Schumannella sp. 10F1B-5-1]